MSFIRIDAKEMKIPKYHKKKMYSYIFENLFSMKTYISRIEFIMQATIYFILALSLILIYIMRNNHFPNMIITYISFYFITCVYIFFLTRVKSILISKVLFMYKNRILDLLYVLNIRFSSVNDKNREVVLVTDNGRLIGSLEGLLFGYGILIQRIELIGIVLAVRSYVTVSSLPNKEESEFYIIGVLGSLLISILFTVIYVLIVYAFLDVNVISEIQNMNLFIFKKLE